MKTLLFSVGVLSLVVPRQVLACTCRELTLDEARAWADVVFSGTVLRIEYVETDGDWLFDDPRIVVTFRVSAYWKGEVGQTITLHTVSNRMSCRGYSFNQGENFIVYAKKGKAKQWFDGGGRRPTLKGIGILKPDDDILETNICSRTNRLANAENDLKALGQPKVAAK